MAVTLDLPQKLEEKLQSAASQQGQPFAEYVVSVLQGATVRNEPMPSPPAADEPAAAAAHPVLRLAQRVRASLPPETFRDLPPDLAINLDRYLYNAPKQEPD